LPAGVVRAAHAYAAWGAHRRFVFRDDDHLCGTCVSIMRDGDRTLLTHAGANGAFADQLEAGFDGLVAYLARARLVHVTSFLDDRTPGRLLAVLTAVRAASPGTLICVDPGHVWSTRPTADIDGILRLADFVLVNEREFRGPAAAATVVVKHPWGVRWFRGRDLAGVRRRVPLPAAEIVDATGAGDVFAAGLLIELAAGVARIGSGCELGLLLARHKLRYLGSAGHAGFAGLVAAFRAAGAALSGAGRGAAPSAADAAAPAPRPGRPCP
jgi:sugar/nucleoside kinase (ribokinase family)